MNPLSDKQCAVSWGEPEEIRPGVWIRRGTSTGVSAPATGTSFTIPGPWAPNTEGLLSGDERSPSMLRTDAVGKLKDYPNLQAVVIGTVSGHFTEWIALRGELLRLMAVSAASSTERTPAEIGRALKEKLDSAPSASRGAILEEAAKVCEQLMPRQSASHLQLQRETLENAAMLIRSLKGRAPLPEAEGGNDG